MHKDQSSHRKNGCHPYIKENNDRHMHDVTFDLNVNVVLHYMDLVTVTDDIMPLVSHCPWFEIE